MQIVRNQSSRSAFALLGIAGLLSAAAMPLAAAATLSQSVVVHASPESVWNLVGPFCAIQQWLPPVKTCTEDRATARVRTLVTKDGNDTFVERQTARSEARRFYSYTFLSSPLPVTNYSSTIKVAAGEPGQSVVTWSGSYTPVAGKEVEARTALSGIYAAGLGSIQQQASRPGTVVSPK